MSPYSPTSARGPPPLGEADDKCITFNREPYRNNFFVDTLLQSNEEKSQTTILDSAWENLACELMSGQI